TLTDPPVTLRRLTPDDAAALARLANNKKVWDHVRDYFPHPYSEDDARAFIDMVQREAPPLTFAIEHSGELCGVVGLVRQADVYRLNAEIGYWLGEPYWGRGIATRAVRLMTDYGFRELGLVSIYAGIFAYNHASMRVREKCGYRQEGVFQKADYKDGRLRDEHVYAIVTPQVERVPLDKG